MLSEAEIKELAKLVAQVSLDTLPEFLTTVETLEDEGIEATDEEISKIHDEASEILQRLYNQI